MSDTLPSSYSEPVYNSNFEPIIAPPTITEVYEEPIAPELKLSQEWVIWESYDSAPGQHAGYKKTQNAATWANMQKVAWFGDIVTFWQLWNTLNFSKLENYFQDKERQTVPVYTIGGDKKRISTLSIFQKDIEPNWEDQKNYNGSEFRFYLQFPMHAENSGFTLLDKVWEGIVLDLVSENLGTKEEIAGIRIVDKSRDNMLNVSLQVWLLFRDDGSDEKKKVRATKIRDFIISEHIVKNQIASTPDNVKFENHHKWNKLTDF